MGLRENVKIYRHKLGLNLGALGAASGGMTATQIKEIEDGTNANPGLITIQKLATGLGLTAAQLMSDEVEDGHDAPRALEVQEVPLLGVSSGGMPIESEQSAESYSLLKHLYGPGRFVVRIYGDSMHPNYWSGDILLAEPKKKVPDGKVALLKIGSETTIKRIYRRRGGGLTLVADNHSTKGFPKETAPGEAEILAEVLTIVEGRRP